MLLGSAAAAGAGVPKPPADAPNPKVEVGLDGPCPKENEEAGAEDVGAAGVDGVAPKEKPDAAGAAGVAAAEPLVLPKPNAVLGFEAALPKEKPDAEGAGAAAPNPLDAGATGVASGPPNPDPKADLLSFPESPNADGRLEDSPPNENELPLVGAAAVLLLPKLNDGLAADAAGGAAAAAAAGGAAAPKDGAADLAPKPNGVEAAGVAAAAEAGLAAGAPKEKPAFSAGGVVVVLEVEEPAPNENAGVSAGLLPNENDGVVELEAPAAALVAAGTASVLLPKEN